MKANRATIRMGEKGWLVGRLYRREATEVSGEAPKYFGPECKTSK